MYVLIADDDPEMRELLAMVLGARGHQTVEASDGAEAIRAARDQAPDAAVVDVTMPKIDGVTVCAELHRIDGLSGLPVVLMSGLGAHEMGTRVKSGAAAHFTKPFSLVALAETLERLVAERG